MTTRKLVYTALLAALTAAGAFLRIPLGVSSITLQFLFTAMAGVLLGAGCGALSQAVYVALGLIPAAAVIGALRGRNPSSLRIALACGAGLLTLYAVGIPYMAVILNGYMGMGKSFSALLWAGMLPFLPGDAVKIAVTAALCPLLLRRLPGLQ